MLPFELFEPDLEFLFLAFHLEGINQPAGNGDGDSAVAQIESVANLVAVELILVNAEFVIERVESTLDAAARQVAALSDQVVGQSQRNIEEGFIFNVGKRCQTVSGAALDLADFGVDPALFFQEDRADGRSNPIGGT